MEEKILKYLLERNISILNLSKKTKIPYSALYDSLSNRKRKRALRVWELFKICDYLEVSADEFR